MLRYPILLMIALVLALAPIRRAAGSVMKANDETEELDVFENDFLDAIEDGNRMNKLDTADDLEREEELRAQGRTHLQIKKTRKKTSRCKKRPSSPRCRKPSPPRRRPPP